MEPTSPPSSRGSPTKRNPPDSAASTQRSQRGAAGKPPPRVLGNTYVAGTDVEGAISVLSREAAQMLPGPKRATASRAVDTLGAAFGRSDGYGRLEGDYEQRASSEVDCGSCCGGVLTLTRELMRAGGHAASLLVFFVGAIFRLVAGILRFAFLTVCELILPLTFYLVGIAAYGHLEGWSPLDTVYFLTVTSTTVGYGDLSPDTSTGRLFTCGFALVGITVILSAFSGFTSVLRGDWRDKLLTFVGLAAKIDTNDPNLTMEQVNRAISYPRRYALALIGPIAVLCSGVALHYHAIRIPPEDPAAYWSLERVLAWMVCGFISDEGCTDPGYFGLAGSHIAIDINGCIDALYWTMITMTTIGYGDITPKTTFAKVLVCLYLPFAVIALADAVADVQMISVRRSIRETDFCQLVDECLLRDATRDPDAYNVEPVLTESEFLIDQVLANDLVDQAAVSAIIRQFKHLTRHGTFEESEERKLTLELTYEERRLRVQAGQPISDEAAAADVGHDGKFKWQSFEDWKKNSWQPRVLAKFAEKKGITEAIRAGRHRAMKTVAGAMARKR
jgi:voltage-gated potassium channel Kch